MTDITRLDLNLLLLLDSLLASGNLSATARQLKMSQPSASAGLSELRHYFGDELFVRTGRGLRPTAFALGLQEPLHAVIDALKRDILNRSTFTPFNSDRAFSLTMPDLSEAIFLPPILAKLHAEAPRIRLVCLDIPYEQVKDALEQQVIDLAIGYFPDLAEPTIRSQLLYEDRFVCISRADHPKVQGRISTEQFLDCEHVTIIGKGRQEAFDHWIKKLPTTQEARLHVPHFMSIPPLVAVSDMVSVVPQSLATSSAQRFPLRIFDPPIALPKIPVKQFWHRCMQTEPGLCWLRGVVADCLVGLEPRETPDDMSSPALRGAQRP